MPAATISAATAVVLSLVSPAGTWRPPLPLPLTVVRAFDPPSVRWAAGHRGVDLAAPVEATVRAAGAGRVSYAGRLAGRGVVVVVHGTLRTTYEPVSASVHVGDQVSAGDPIASLQAGHDPARPAAGVLHWGLLRGDTYLDPMSLLTAPLPVRLLPFWDAGAAPGSSTGTLVARDIAARSERPRGAPPPAPPQGPSSVPMRAAALAVGAGALAAAGVWRPRGRPT
ncbi:MAG: M23 family metallopeptidase [Actinomycetota bacterium]